MPTVTYTVFEGEILSEDRAGTERDYVPDPLGSTVALLDNTQAQTDTFTYWPYGEEKSRTGTTETAFGFGGAWGYYTDAAGITYVRARHIFSIKGRWLTTDPLGFYGQDWSYYRYVRDNPVSIIDRSGLFPCVGCYLLPLNLILPCIAKCGPANKVYGNWCGPSYPPEGQNPQPIDKLDACCQKHDGRYRKSTLSAGDIAHCHMKRMGGCFPPRCSEIDEADRELCNCAREYDCGWDLDCIVSRRLMMTWFCPGFGRSLSYPVGGGFGGNLPAK